MTKETGKAVISPYFLRKCGSGGKRRFPQEGELPKNGKIGGWHNRQNKLLNLYKLLKNYLIFEKTHAIL